MKSFATLCVFCLLASLPAAAQEIRPPDATRLSAFDATLGRALRQAFGTGEAGHVAVLRETLAGAPAGIAPEGIWHCRTLKLGGVVALVAYRDFSCEITAAGPGQWKLIKTTGSQRMEGLIDARSDPAIYRGVGYVSGGPAVDYDGLPPLGQDPVYPGQTVAQIGVFEQMGHGRARLMLPAPILESDFDILYLTR